MLALANLRAAYNPSGYNDFSAEWFGVVGVTLVLTMQTNMFIPHITQFVMHCVEKLKQYALPKYYPYRYLHQEELNSLYTHPEFKTSDRYAQCLATLLTTMTYQAGTK